MRHCAFFLILLTACKSGPDKSEPIPLTKVVFRQYYKGSPVFLIESLSGRDLVKLRSDRGEPGQIKPAYVPDEVMVKLLDELRRAGYHDYSTARPRDPRKIGGRAELTIVGQGRYKDGRGRPIEAFIRRDGQGKDAYDTYKKCVDTFRAVHAHYGQFQASAGGGDFGVKKAEFER